MSKLDIFKALSNETRLNTFEMVERTCKNIFRHKGYIFRMEMSFSNSVCVGSICEKTNISQSTISHYLDMLQRAGLLESRRFGKWTYYRRNEKNIQELAEFIRSEL